MKRLYRSRSERMIAGINGGLGQYLGVDPTILRLIWVILTLATGGVPGIVLYFFFWIIIPLEPASGMGT